MRRGALGSGFAVIAAELRSLRNFGYRSFTTRHNVAGFFVGTMEVPAHRFMHGTEAPLLVWIEPWCEEIAVPSGSTLILSFELAPGEDDQTLIELTEERLVYWCGGSTYEAELDGKLLPA